MKKNTLFDEHGFVRVGVFCPQVTVGNPDRNRKEIVKIGKELHACGVQYASGTELSLTGYTIGDMIVNRAIEEYTTEALLQLVADLYDCNIMMTVGVQLRVRGKLYNCAVTFARGKILGINPKLHLPQYGEFREDQWFVSAREADFTTVTIGCHKDIPFGVDVCYQLTEDSDALVHVEVCEDGWVPNPPSRYAAAQGATILANVSASNITVGKGEYRKLIMQANSGACIAAQLYASAGGGEDTTDVAFDGHIFIAERGEIMAQERFIDSSHFAIYDIDINSLIRDRARQGTFYDNASDFVPFAIRRVYAGICIGKGANAEQRQSQEELVRVIHKHPFVPHTILKMDERCKEIMHIQATGLAQRLEQFPEENRIISIGVSGGLDSTLALLVACLTVDMIGLSRSNIDAVTMPYDGNTSAATRSNAEKLAKALHCTFSEFNITSTVQQNMEAVGYNPENDTSQEKRSFQNMQAGARTDHLINRTRVHGGLLLGTGDLTETFLNWCTFDADHLSHYNVNATVPKMLVRHLVEWTAKTNFATHRQLQDTLMSIVQTKISPELDEKDGEEVGQKTEELIGPFELAEFLMYWLIRFHHTPRAIFFMALHAFGDRYTPEEIARWMRLHLKLFRSQFKRDVSMAGPKIGIVSFSSRGDWRMASNMDITVFMREMDKVDQMIQEHNTKSA